MADNSIDQHIGQRLAQARAANAQSLQQVANGLGITYQQVRKYEQGINRISASTLFRLATILGVEPTYFFEGLQPTEATTQPAERDQANAALHRIPDDEVRAKLRDLITALGANG